MTSSSQHLPVLWSLGTEKCSPSGAGNRSDPRKGLLFLSWPLLGISDYEENSVFFSLSVNTLALCSRIFLALLWWISFQEWFQRQEEIFVCLPQHIQGSCLHPCSVMTPQELLLSRSLLSCCHLKDIEHTGQSRTEHTGLSRTEKNSNWIIESSFLSVTVLGLCVCHVWIYPCTGLIDTLWR